MSLAKLMASLELLSTINIDENPRVHRVRGAKESIYVMNAGRARIFFTKKDGDIVLLSIENG